MKTKPKQRNPEGVRFSTDMGGTYDLPIHKKKKPKPKNLLRTDNETQMPMTWESAR